VVNGWSAAQGARHNAAILPLRRPSELRDPKVHRRVLSLTEGVMVRICRLLETAAVLAIETDRENGLQTKEEASPC